MKNIFRNASWFLTTMLIMLLPAQSFAAVKIVADVGQPAPDFPEGFIYWDIDSNPVIGHPGILPSPARLISALAQLKTTPARWGLACRSVGAIVRENEPVSGFDPMCYSMQPVPRRTSVDLS